MKMVALLMSCVTLVMLISPALAGVPSVDVSDKGVVAVALDGCVISLPCTPDIWWIKDGDGKPINRGKVVTTGDATARKVTTTYGWGSLGTTFEPLDSGFRATVRITNASTVTVNHIIMSLVKIKSLGEKTTISRQANGITGPLLVGATGRAGSIVLSAHDDGKPLGLEITRGREPKTKEDFLEARIELGGDKVIADGVLSSRPIPPGVTESFVVEVRLGGAGSSHLDLAKPALDAYRKAHPMLLKWADRRPVLRLFFGGGLPKEQANANLKDPDKVKPPESDPKFRERVLKRVTSTVDAAKAANAQAVIFWDLEGETYPHATTYIGDPRHIRLLNPQMDLVIDEAMKLLTDAGIKVGVTLRPSHVVYDAEKNSAKHKHEGYDPFEELDAKVTYAKKRWGCRIFYVDTDFFWRPYGREKKWQSGQLTSALWKQLLTKYPDTLFVPEFANYADYAYVAGYGEADMGDYATPELVRAIWPDAFRVLVIEDADPYVNYDRFVSAVRGRNALMTYSFDPKGRNTVAMIRMYQEAALREKGEPKAIKKADKGKLVAGLVEDDLATRYFSASRLADLGDATTAAPLLARATDTNEEWIVRRQAIRAFEKIRSPDAVPELVRLAVDQKTMFTASAAKALAGQGSVAVAPVVAALEGTTGLAPDMIGILGGILVDLKASDQAPRLMALYAQPFKGNNPNGRKGALIELLGKLGNKVAEPMLLEAFKDPALQGVATTALLRIGSAEGSAQIKAALEKAKDDKRQDLVTTLSDAMRKAE